MSNHKGNRIRDSIGTLTSECIKEKGSKAHLWTMAGNDG